MKQDQITGLLRHVLTFFGGFLVARGKISAELVEAVIGAIVTLGGAAWSIMQKLEKPALPPVAVPPSA